MPFEPHHTQQIQTPKPLTGARLRGLAFALLGKREYAKAALRDKLLSFGVADETELEILLDELASNNYQSDQRMAEITVRENIRKGRGPLRIKQSLQQNKLDTSLAQENITEVDWLAQASALRKKKFGDELPTTANEKARQYRFLLYRGFDSDICRRALNVNE